MRFKSVSLHIHRYLKTDKQFSEKVFDSEKKPHCQVAFIRMSVQVLTLSKRFLLNFTLFFIVTKSKQEIKFGDDVCFLCATLNGLIASHTIAKSSNMTSGYVSSDYPP